MILKTTAVYYLFIFKNPKLFYRYIVFRCGNWIRIFFFNVLSVSGLVEPTPTQVSPVTRKYIWNFQLLSTGDILDHTDWQSEFTSFPFWCPISKCHKELTMPTRPILLEQIGNLLVEENKRMLLMARYLA